MKGLLIVNHFMRGAKFRELEAFLMSASKNNNIELETRTNAEVHAQLSQDIHSLDGYNFVLFWDKDVRLAKRLELLGLRVFNSADAIERCDDKSLTYLSLLPFGIKMPRTVLLPKVFDGRDLSEYNEVISSVETLGYPVVIKECFGSFGEQVSLANNRGELKEIIGKLGGRPALAEEYIGTRRGEDIRVEVVGGEIAACMRRFSVNGDFRANLTIGGSMEEYKSDEAQKEMAVTACKALGLDFGGVDILFGENGEPVLCEVNSNAHFVNIMRCTGVDVADLIFRYINKVLG